MTERLHFHFSLSCIGEGNGNPLQCSCLENPRDGGAWWASVYGVTQSRTRLKRLSSSSSSCCLFQRRVPDHVQGLAGAKCSIHISSSLANLLGSAFKTFRMQQLLLPLPCLYHYFVSFSCLLLPSRFSHVRLCATP